MNQTMTWFDFEQFAHMAGFHEGLTLLEEKGQVKWTNTATDMSTGGIHGIRYKVLSSDKNSFDISLQHWVRWPGGEVPAEGRRNNFDPEFLKLRTETRTTPDGRLEIRPVGASWMGKEYGDPPSLMKLMHLLQDTSGEIRSNIARNTEQRAPHDPSVFSGMQRKTSQTKRRDEIPNIYDLTKRIGIYMPNRLPGMSFNGEFNFKKYVNNGATPAFPKAVIHAALGIEDDALRHDYRAFARTVSVPDSHTQGYEGVTYFYKPAGKNASDDGFTLSCKIWDAKADGTRKETEFYSVSFAPDPSDKAQFILEDMKVLGFAPDITKQKGVSRALRALKYINLSMKRGELPGFSDILNGHDLKAFLRAPQSPEAKESDPRTSIQVFGANMDAAFTEKEKGIGSNGLVVIKDFEKDGKWIKLAIGADWGVTFGDSEKDYYNTISHNYGRFMTHPAAPHIEPYADTFLNVETHEHEDHLRGIVKFAKFGYNIPPMVMNRHTYNVLKRMMLEERVRKDKIDSVLENCHVIDITKSVNRDAPEKRERFEYGDTVIEQWTEVLESGEKPGEKKYFPIMEAYKKQYPDAKTTIRVGPAGHSAHAVMFDVGGILYTGDYKMDQTIDEGVRTDLDWLAKCKDGAVHIQECTNATKSVPFNATVAEVKENRKEILRAEEGKRVLYDTIGSNAIDISMICRAAGEVRKEVAEDKGMEKPFGSDLPYEYVIFAGAAIQNKYRDLNETHNFKSMMNKDYGIKTLHIGSKKAQELLAQKGGSYVVIMSGTQDEPMSVTHRVSRDLHDKIRLQQGDVVIRGQAPIPVGNNYQKRIKQNARYRNDFGCVVYDAVEMAQKGKHIYTSSHASQDDVRRVHDVTGDLLKIPFHGGPEQINKMHELLQEHGARSVIPDKQALYQIDFKNKTVEIIGETQEERVGYREIRADQEEFYNKHRQQATVKRVKDRWHGDVAERMYRFENLAEKREQDRRSHKPTDRGVNLANDFTESAGVNDFPPIGILHPDIKLPYCSNQKNIKVMVGMDAETTGKDAKTDVHTDISFVATDMEGNVQKEIMYKHRLPGYKMASVGALGVTGNNDPKKLHIGGMDSRKFAFNVLQLYKNLPAALTEDTDARGLFYGYRNNVFDDQITMRMLGMGLASNDMKPMATYGNLQLDVYNLYTAMIALIPDKVGAAQDEKGNYIRTLETACKENGIEYDKAKAHGSLYDAQRAMHLLMKLKEISPDVFEQMVMNCDFSASRPSPMIDHILGQNLHLNDQAPVFGYVDPRDRQCKPSIGALVMIDTEEGQAKQAIVLNLAKADVHALEDLSDEKLLEAMNDPNGPFTVLHLNNSPCMFPPEFVYGNPAVRRNAIGRLPKSTLLKRADALKKMRSDSSNIGNDFMQRVQRLYQGSKLARGTGGWNGKALPQSKAFRLPNERIFSLFKLMNNKNATKNRHYREAGKLLRSLQPTAEEFKRGFDKESFWKHALHEANRISKESGGHDQNIEDMKFLIEWHIDDINPKWLPEETRHKMNALKSTMLNGAENAHSMTVDRFLRELDDLENDPEDMNRLIGAGKNSKAWEDFKEACLGYADGMEKSRRYKMTEAKLEEARERKRQGTGGKFSFN